ncbi:MAG: sigma-70 family RNA polymerase sigma factor [Pirellulales bacterium]
MSIGTTEVDESDVIRRVLQGEWDAYGIIVARYQQRIYCAMYAMMGNREDAEDLTQECLTLGFRKLRSFEGRSSMYTWLHRIAMNLAISHRRKHRRETSMSRTSMEVAEPSLARDDEPIEDQIDRADEQLLVRKAIQRLDQQQQSVLVLRDVQGMDYSEIAEVLEIPIGTVRSRLHRARLELKGVLELMKKMG